MTPTEHFSRLLQLLELEADAEKEELLVDLQRRSPAEAEAAGSSLIKLALRGEEAGLGGRVLLTFGKRNQTLPLPWSRLRVGAPVLLSAEEATGSGWRGVVSRLERDAIQVAFSGWPDVDETAAFRLDRAADEVARQRLRQALRRLPTVTSGRLKELRDVLLGQQPPLFSAPVACQPLDETLNASQQAAVRQALSAADLAIIHGPPGTGKTTTVIELIRQLTRRGQTVLACAPSNLAVDNLLQGLLAAGEAALRLGHPARVLPELQAHTLDLLVENHPDTRLARQLTREAHALRDKAAKYTRAKPEPGARRAQRQEAKQMLADARRIEQQVTERLLASARIICATTTLDPHMLGDRIFDWCVLDEAGQATEPEVWLPLQYAERLVLAGDHCQLPPTVISPQAVAGGFNVSLLERLVGQLGPEVSRRLTVQYRMHTEIMAFSSREFYEDSLQADASVGMHLLADLPGVEANALTTTPVDFIDTAGASFDEAVEPDGDSRFNPSEAELAAKKVAALLDAGLAAEDIAVIAPYSAQVKLLRQLLPQPGLEINSVDGFQGREKEAVVISLVRANGEGEIGFLADVRRMNVALTRARRKLIVIGDSATITRHPFYQRLVEYFEAGNAYHSVWEELV